MGNEQKRGKEEKVYCDVITAMTEIFCNQEKEINALEREIQEIRDDFVFKCIRKLKRILESKQA